MQVPRETSYSVTFAEHMLIAALRDTRSGGLLITPTFDYKVLGDDDPKGDLRHLEIEGQLQHPSRSMEVKGEAWVYRSSRGSWDNGKISFRTRQFDRLGEIKTLHYRYDVFEEVLQRVIPTDIYLFMDAESNEVKAQVWGQNGAEISSESEERALGKLILKYASLCGLVIHRRTSVGIKI